MKTTSIALALALVACGKKAEENKGGGGSSSAPAVKEAASGSTVAVPDWAPKDAEALWQGAWSTRMNPLAASKNKSTSMAGDPVAIEVKGNKATVTDGTAEVTMDFKLKAPCEASFAEAITEGSMKGGTSYHDMMFVVQNGALVVGTGAAGYRKGKAAIVCSEGMDGGVTVLGEDGKCSTSAEKFGKQETKNTTCAWSQENGKDVLTIGTGNFAPKLEADGDVLMSQQFRDSTKYTQKAKDYADAKAQLQAEVDAKNPSKQAEKAGGIVGKTDTVVSFIATWGTDKSLKGKPFEITATYLNANSMTSNGEKTHNVILVDKVGGDSKLSLSCDLGKTEPPAGLKQGDKVKAKGTVDESFDKPTLANCTIDKAK